MCEGVLVDLGLSVPAALAAVGVAVAVVAGAERRGGVRGGASRESACA